jgi:pyrroloquinoline quinone biosynthesis protein E
MMLVGDASATDPVCTKSPDHGAVLKVLQEAGAARKGGEFTYRAIAGRQG